MGGLEGRGSESVVDVGGRRGGFDVLEGRSGFDVLEGRGGFHGFK